MNKAKKFYQLGKKHCAEGKQPAHNHQSYLTGYARSYEISERQSAKDKYESL